MHDNNPYLLNKTHVRRAFERAAASYAQSSIVQREISHRLLERLDLIRLQPATLLELGSATGDTTSGLFKKYPKAHLIALDASPAMLARTRTRKPWRRKLSLVCADAEQLPLADASCDMIISNLTLHWCNDLQQVFAECWRVLKPQGLLLFSSYGPDTLLELRQSWAAADDQTHVHAFMDMHDVGDALIRTQFADPVMDAERLTVTYADPRALLQDLQQLGAVNASAGRLRGLTGKHKFQTMLTAYESYRQNGLIPATLEVVYGHAWKPEAVRARRLDNGTAVFPVAQLTRR
ncbi:MAG: malonyl-ACP O-methyltransferase BioC [Candidatus Competibacteraceae bacterium]|nr:malonyl-ACP O-methyltransferase BioC [Candidatus Competibacteraceae bacterium]